MSPLSQKNSDELTGAYANQQHAWFGDLAYEFAQQKSVGALNKVAHKFLQYALSIRSADNCSTTILPLDAAQQIVVPVPMGQSGVVHRKTDTLEAQYLTKLIYSRRAQKLNSPCEKVAESLGLIRDKKDREDRPRLVYWGLPLHSRGSLHGFLIVSLRTDKSAHLPDSATSTVLEKIASHLAIAVDNLLLSEKQRSHQQKLYCLNNLAQMVAVPTSSREFINRAILILRETFSLNKVALYDGDLNTLTELGTRGRAAETPTVYAEISRGLGHGIHIRKEEYTHHALPIIVDDKVEYVIYAKRLTASDEDEEQSIISLLNIAGNIICACCGVHQANNAVEAPLDETVKALIRTLKARDPYTAEHSFEITEWVVECGRRLGLSGERLNDLELASLLHDIGKIAIPDSILSKTGRLTDDEFEVMKSHTTAGEEILEPIGKFKHVAPIVRSEHERWDGRGYPDGLAGEAIPLESRIIFVCDTYHAITSDRPYRKGQTPEFARRIIDENAGTQFDPAVVSVFQDVIEQWLLDNGFAANPYSDSTGIEITNPLRKPDTPQRDESLPQSDLEAA